MTLIESVQICLRKYTDLGGRAQLSEFWLFVTFLIISCVILRGLGAIIGVIVADDTPSNIAMIPILVLLVPSLAVSVRRLHDTGRSAWWLLLLLIPVLGTIPLLVFLALPGTVGPNRYGESLTDLEKGPSFIRWLLQRYHTRPLPTLAVSLLCVTVWVLGCYWSLATLAPPPPHVVGYKIDVTWGRDTAAVSWKAVEGATHYKVFQMGIIPSLDGKVKAPGTRYEDDSPNTGAGILAGFSTTSYRVKACNWFACSRFSNMVTVH